MPSPPHTPKGDGLAVERVSFELPQPEPRLMAPSEAPDAEPARVGDGWRRVIGWEPAHAELSRGRKIGLIDLAVDPSSPLVPRDAFIQRYRFSDDGLPVHDDQDAVGDHGTRSAATILAVAPHAELHAFALPASFRRGAGSALELMVAISELAIRGVDIICVNAVSRTGAGFANAFSAPDAAVDALRMHLNELEYYRAVGQLLETTLAAAPLIVTGTGNDSLPGVRLPAALPGRAWNALTVGAIDPDGRIHGFSQSGAQLVAPGDVDLSSRRPFRGTSAAAALTAGVAALWAGAVPQHGRREQLRAHLIASARLDLLAGEPHPDDVGAGVVRVPPPPR